MACVACFFSDGFQKTLKRGCPAQDSFEKKLIFYKSSYLNTLKSLKSVKDCDCLFKKENNVYIIWMDAFLQNLLNNENVVNDTFEAIIDIYMEYISKSNKKALDSIWKFLEDNSLLEEAASTIVSSRLLFRGRPVKDFNMGVLDTNVYEYFHIPFNKRSTIANQRFSINGQPLLYLTTSILAVEKEMELKLNKLNIAAFMPQRNFYNRFYHVNNSIYDVLVKTLPVFCAAGSQIDYFNEEIAPNYKTIITDLRKSIFFQILTFPNDRKGLFVEEYVLPQMLTTALLDHGFNGIIFNSTKDYEDLTNAHMYANYDLNIAFFVNYSFSQNYDQELLDSFIYFLPSKKSIWWHVLERLRSFMLQFLGDPIKRSPITQSLNDRFFNVLRLSGQRGNLFSGHLAVTKLQIEYMQTAKLKGMIYFDTAEGQMELEFYQKMVDELERRLR